jgi:hypothetical protein
MNTCTRNSLRYFAIVLLFVIGIASIIATGGSGADGSFGQQPVTDTRIAITAANGEDISSAVVIAIGVSFDLGEITDIALMEQAAGDSSNLFGLKGMPKLYAKSSNPLAYAPKGCAIGGIVDVTITVADPNVPTIGDQVVAVFDSCDDNLGFIISGTIDLTISAVQGDLNTDVFLIGFNVILTDISITQASDTVTADGGFTLTLDALDFPVMTMTMTGKELQFGDAGDLITLSNFDHFLTVDSGVVPDVKLAEASGRLDSQVLGGSIDYDTTTSIEASGDNDPHTGVILVSGSGGSSVRIVIVDSTSVTLEIDTNGDGVVDQYIDTSWAALSQQTGAGGETSSVNTSTAPIIAREVFNGVSGFGSVTVTAGGQFSPTAVFGQLRQQTVSGNFGPLTVDCMASGTAELSGSIATAGTFTANDQLGATFTNCVRGGEELDRRLDVVVNSFADTPGDGYLVTATATETDMLRFIGGSCYSGTGTFDTSYDFVYTTAGSVQAQSSANTFVVWSGGRTQTLHDALVSTQITVGQQPVTVTRASSGTITSEDLVGSFAYESVTPDVFLLDNQSTTGPYSGELLIKASDGSTMTMVALNDFNVRLDLDFNGDSITDEQIMTTWAILGYGNTFGLCEQ